MIYVTNWEAEALFDKKPNFRQRSGYNLSLQLRAFKIQAQIVSGTVQKGNLLEHVKRELNSSATVSLLKCLKMINYIFM